MKYITEPVESEQIVSRRIRSLGSRSSQPTPEISKNQLYRTPEPVG